MVRSVLIVGKGLGSHMTTDQIILFALFGAVFGLLLWGRWRYDLVAFSALMIGVVLGVVCLLYTSPSPRDS